MEWMRRNKKLPGNCLEIAWKSPGNFLEKTCVSYNWTCLGGPFCTECFSKRYRQKSTIFTSSMRDSFNLYYIYLHLYLLFISLQLN